MSEEGRHKSYYEYGIMVINDCPLRRAAYSALFKLYGSKTAVVGKKDVEIPEGTSIPDGGALTLVVFGSVLISSVEGRAKLEAVLQNSTGRVVALVETHTAECVSYALDMQLAGVLTTSEETSVVFAALDFIAAGGCYIPHAPTETDGTQDVSLLKDNAARMCDHERNEAITKEVSKALTSRPAFTRRQNDVLFDLAHGKSNKAIAANLGISEATVKSHIRQVMIKLNVRNRTQAALLARDLV
ncbi:LuxR C-terminal-related transcriptional regulator [Marivita sp. S0852]|uniref:helix-turn-helix transcriptional regulator n=1 Tax=Marivita sp. S0852 TaxID=3373893 RepID=UPI0039820B68